MPVTITRRPPKDLAVSLRSKMVPTPDGKKKRPPKSGSVERINHLIDKGLIDPNSSGMMGDPNTLDQFIRLYNMGASEEVTIQVLNINKAKYKHLLGQYQDMCVGDLVKMGPMGVLAEAYTRINQLSRKALEGLSLLEMAKGTDRKEILELMRFVKEAESEKIRMIVTTGAVPHRKKVNVQDEFSPVNSASNVVSPGALLNLLSAAIDGDYEVSGEDDDTR